MARVRFYWFGSHWVFRKEKVRLSWVFLFVLINFSHRGFHGLGQHFEVRAKMPFSRVLESPNAKHCAKTARISGIFKVPKLLKLIFIYLENIY